MATILASLEALDGFCRSAFTAAGADAATSEAATASMLHGTRFGVDSHGVRLLEHYVRALEGGRIQKAPTLRFTRKAGAVTMLDAGHAQGALAAYRAMDHAVEIAGEMGVGAVGITDSSHFGPAGAYALRAAEAGCIGLAVCNSDSLVRLHDGATRFHGTNPIAVGVPVAGEEPWLLDMATSAIPFNRVQLYASLARALPAGVASREDGTDTTVPDEAAMLAPLGGDYGYKGAALAGVAEILSAVLTGMTLSFDLAPMAGPDFASPRGLGAFVLALKPETFVDRAVFETGMRRYRDSLRASAPREGGEVLAPGDREWAVAARRGREGAPLDPVTVEGFTRLAERYGLALPWRG